MGIAGFELLVSCLSGQGFIIHGLIPACCLKKFEPAHQICKILLPYLVHDVKNDDFVQGFFGKLLKLLTANHSIKKNKSYNTMTSYLSCNSTTLGVIVLMIIFLFFRAIGTVFLRVTGFLSLMNHISV